MTYKNSLWGARIYLANNRGAEPFSIRVKGRDRWALENLINAGDAGCTPIDNPALCWSAMCSSCAVSASISKQFMRSMNALSAGHMRGKLLIPASCRIMVKEGCADENLDYQGR